MSETLAEKNEIKLESSSLMKKITMTYYDFVESFFPAFILIGGFKSSENSGKLKFAIRKSVANIDRVNRAYNELKSDLFDTHCKKDKEGNPVIKDTQFLFDSPEVRKATYDKLKELNDTEVSFQIMPIGSDDIRKCNPITILQEIALRDMVIDTDPMEADPNSK
jgi:hypothetical protein